MRPPHVALRDGHAIRPTSRRPSPVNAPDSAPLRPGFLFVWQVIAPILAPNHNTGRPAGAPGQNGAVNVADAGDKLMIRSELIQKIAEENTHLYQRDVERIVNTIFDEITESLARGERVELRGFGAFSVKHRDARIGRNPRTGESVAVEAKAVPFFKTGKLLRDRLNGKED